MDVEKWRRHFQRMADGKVKPNHRGHYIVEKIQSGGDTTTPEIKFVTPVAQDVEMAKSEIKANKSQTRERVQRGYKRKRHTPFKPNRKPYYVDNVFKD